MLSALANMRTNARVLDASLDALSSQMPDKQVAEPASRSASGPLAYAISHVPCLKAPEGTRCAAWCHAAVLDANEGFWSLTSAIEGDAVVLVALRGSLSQPPVRLQRMCCYRMRMPSELFDALPQRAMLRRSLLPHPAQDAISMTERLEKMKEATARLDRWYHSHDCPIEDTFSPEVVVVRHVTDFVTGAQATRCFTFDDLRKQTRVSFGRERSKHVLGETHVPHHCLSMTQCYEVTRDSSGQPWRQSSIRVRVFDPLDNYKLKVGLILYSERDKFPNGQLPQNGGLIKGPSACLNTSQPRPQAVMPPPQPHHVAPSPALRPPGASVKRARVADAGVVQGRA